jgi:hypothetical protein
MCAVTTEQFQETRGTEQQLTLTTDGVLSSAETNIHLVNPCS